MKFDSLTVEYLAGCLSPKTAKRYGTSLRTWVDWCRGNEVDPMLATRAEFERLRALAPKGSRLSTMTSDGAKREIERRYQG